MGAAQTGGCDMTSTVAERTVNTTPWFASWFDSIHYHKLYAHRDETEAARFIDQLIAHLGPSQGAHVLDLGCGAGRYSRQLAAKGLRVVGMDLAAGSIKEARKCELPSLR